MKKRTPGPQPERQPAEKHERRETGYTREDLRRDTYVPGRDVSGSPRPHESANRR